MQKVGARPPNTAADIFLESAKPVYDTSVGKISKTAALIGLRENAINNNNNLSRYKAQNRP